MINGLVLIHPNHEFKTTNLHKEMENSWCTLMNQSVSGSNTKIQKVTVFLCPVLTYSGALLVYELGAFSLQPVLLHLDTSLSKATSLSKSKRSLSSALGTKIIPAVCSFIGNLFYCCYSFLSSRIRIFEMFLHILHLHAWSNTCLINL